MNVYILLTFLSLLVVASQGTPIFTGCFNGHSQAGYAYALSTTTYALSVNVSYNFVCDGQFAAFLSGYWSIYQPNVPQLQYEVSGNISIVGLWNVMTGDNSAGILQISLDPDFITFGNCTGLFDSPPFGKSGYNWCASGPGLVGIVAGAYYYGIQYGLLELSPAGASSPEIVVQGTLTPVEMAGPNTIWGYKSMEFNQFACTTCAPATPAPSGTPVPPPTTTYPPSLPPATPVPTPSLPPTIPPGPTPTPTPLPPAPTPPPTPAPTPAPPPTPAPTATPVDICCYASCLRATPNGSGYPFCLEVASGVTCPTNYVKTGSSIVGGLGCTSGSTCISSQCQPAFPLSCDDGESDQNAGGNTVWNGFGQISTCAPNSCPDCGGPPPPPPPPAPTPPPTPAPTPVPATQSCCNPNFVPAGNPASQMCADINPIYCGNFDPANFYGDWVPGGAGSACNSGSLAQCASYCCNPTNPTACNPAPVQLTPSECASNGYAWAGAGQGQSCRSDGYCSNGGRSVDYTYGACCADSTHCGLTTGAQQCYNIGDSISYACTNSPGYTYKGAGTNCQNDIDCTSTCCCNDGAGPGANFCYVNMPYPTCSNLATTFSGYDCTWYGDGCQSRYFSCSISGPCPGCTTCPSFLDPSNLTLMLLLLDY